MFKIILAFCSIVALAQGEVKELDTYTNAGYDYKYRPDDFITSYRQHFTKVIQDYDTTLDYFRAHYAARVEEINMYSNLVADDIVHLEELLNPLEFRSDYSKYCVKQNRDSIPAVLDIQNEMGKCSAEALDQLDTLCNSPLDTRNVLQAYYANTFESELSTCAEKPETEEIYVKCISEVIEKATAYTVENQKEFKYRLEAIQCAADANMKRAFDCSYNVQFDATSQAAQADLLIRKCLAREHECKPCQHSCLAALELTPTQVYSNAVVNPFFNRTDTLDCFILAVQQNDQYEIAQHNDQYEIAQQNDQYENVQQNDQYENAQQPDQYEAMQQYDLNPKLQ